MRWILVDVSSVAYQLFYAMNQDADSIIPAFLKRIEQFEQRFNSNRVAFFFDRGKSKRCDVYKEYKANRKPLTESERLLKRYLAQLAMEVLPNNGQKNIYHQKGYEADDLIASACDNLNGEHAVIVSTDKDLYQCISDHVTWYNGRVLKTHDSFTMEFGIEPSQYADVKAIAGCNTDNVKGIEQIGDRSAIRFLTGNLFNWRYQLVVLNNEIWERNLQLTKLPFEGTMKVEL